MTITCIDCEFLKTPNVIASYLVEGPQGRLLLECGPASVQATLEAKLQAMGVELESIQHVLVSHIHLDHSGGAGQWARRGARIYVHPKGAPHLVDPSKLLASASRIYLDRMDELWGTTLPIPEEQVIPLPEGTISLAGLEIRAWETPGHAAHHLAFGIGGDLFTGDVAGCRLPGSDYVSVPAPPPEFHLETWLSSLDKLITLAPERLHLTHFGGDFPAQAHLNQLRSRLQECVRFVAEQDPQLSPENLQQLYQAWDREQAARHGVDATTYDRYEKANPSFMSAQGISRYLRKYRPANA
jgi:glyoxylase-like metal-dependent hydrolase (beta-lactamase superfamily II)